MGSEDWPTHRRSLERPFEMDNIAVMGANPYVRPLSKSVTGL